MYFISTIHLYLYSSILPSSIHHPFIHIHIHSSFHPVYHSPTHHPYPYSSILSSFIHPSTTIHLYPHSFILPSSLPSTYHPFIHIHLHPSIIHHPSNYSPCSPQPCLMITLQNTWISSIGLMECPVTKRRQLCVLCTKQCKLTHWETCSEMGGLGFQVKEDLDWLRIPLESNGAFRNPRRTWTF